MSRREVREPIVISVNRDGFVSNGFTVMPTNNFSRVGPGHYVMIPVLSEQAGDDYAKQWLTAAVQP